MLFDCHPVNTKFTKWDNWSFFPFRDKFWKYIRTLCQNRLNHVEHTCWKIIPPNIVHAYLWHLYFLLVFLIRILLILCIDNSNIEQESTFNNQHDFVSILFLDQDCITIAIFLSILGHRKVVALGSGIFKQSTVLFVSRLMNMFNALIFFFA